jgi:hypothetical protein
MKINCFLLTCLYNKNSVCDAKGSLKEVCPFEIEKSNKNLCEDCRKNEAKLKFANEPMFALTHGVGLHQICRTCFIKKLRKQLKAIRGQIREQRKLIEEEKCERED